MMSKNLAEWVNYIQTQHALDMDLSLERVQLIAERLNIKPACPVMTVGGTNGKGSCVAGLESIYRAAGYRVGAFTSPVLFRHNEYARIDGDEVSDAAFCLAYEAVERARGEVTLTAFEYTALAAFLLFQQANLDVWLLEVGLGGRYDAVNVLDADIAVIASIGIDHTAWLGETREQIAFEKSGIFRKNKPVVCGDFNPPATLIQQAEKLNSPFYLQEKTFSSLYTTKMTLSPSCREQAEVRQDFSDFIACRAFSFHQEENSWSWNTVKKTLNNLPLPTLSLQNMATVLMAIELLQDRLSVSEESIRTGLSNVKLKGRIEQRSLKPSIIFDVSHNPDAAAFLAKWLKEHPVAGNTRAVFSMLSDKDIAATIESIKAEIDEWFIAELDCKRRAAIYQLTESLQQAGVSAVTVSKNIAEAYQSALQKTQREDRIIVFGSFHTVEAFTAP